MTVNILTFAQAKDYFAEEFSVELAENASINDLLKTLVELQPQSQKMLEGCRFACNENIVDNSQVLHQDETVAVLPPSSGGVI